MCFATDIIHSGHIAIIHEATKLGRLIAGVLSDEAVAEYRRKPLVSQEDRLNLFKNIKGIAEVMVQEKLSYADVLRKLKPAYVVHGDDWREGQQKSIRDEVIEVLAEYGGRLIECPYCMDSKYKELENKLALIND